MDRTVVFAGDLPAATISDRVRRGQLVRLATGVYTTDVKSGPAAVVAREWHVIVGRILPRAVITDRSARTGGPAEGMLYLSQAGRDRVVEFPGLTVLARSGAGPLDGDVLLHGGLHQASKPRALAENTRPSRSRGRGLSVVAMIASRWGWANAWAGRTRPGRAVSGGAREPAARRTATVLG